MGGFSLRRHVIAQCPTMNETQVREHIDFVHQTMKVNPSLDIRRYRVSSEGVRDNG